MADDDGTDPLCLSTQQFSRLLVLHELRHPLIIPVAETFSNAQVKNPEHLEYPQHGADHHDRDQNLLDGRVHRNVSGGQPEQ